MGGGLCLVSASRFLVVVVPYGVKMVYNGLAYCFITSTGLHRTKGICFCCIHVPRH